MAKSVTKKSPVKELSSTKEESLDLPLALSFFINLCVFTTPLYTVIMLLFSFHFIKGFFNSNVFLIEFLFNFFYPLVIILAIGIYVACVVEISSWIIAYLNIKSPPVQGMFQRKFPASKVIQYYHYRGFVIKYPLWLAYKSPIPGPWAINWVLRKIGHNKIDKNVMMLDSMPALEFLTVEENVVFYPGSVTSTHLVDSIFGNLSIFENIIKKDSIILPSSGMPLGAYLTEKSTFMPNAFCRKKWSSGGNKGFYSGVPVKEMKEYNGVFSILSDKILKIYEDQGYVTGEQIDHAI